MTLYKQDNDEAIVSDVLKGEINKFEVIVKRYFQKIYRFSYHILKDKYLAEDVTQETFLRAFRFLNHYNKDYKFSNWIFKIAYNISMDKINIKKRNGNIIKSLNPKKTITPEALIETKFKRESVKKAIELLDFKFKIVIILKYYMDFSIDTIANILNTSSGNVKFRLFKARNILKTLLKEKV